MFMESIKEIDVRFLALQQDMSRMNRLSDNKSETITLQNKQINDLRSYNEFAEKNSELLKKQLADEKKRKVKYTVIGISTTALITATVMSIIK